MGRTAFGIGVAIVVAIAAAARAQSPPDPGEIHGLRLGLEAKSMTLDDWGELACGSNGGPPRQTLDTWSDFIKCAPEPSGLREVAARFDDEEEYVGRANDGPLYSSQTSGTRVAGHPVILSALFDPTGVLRGIRVVTDPRGTGMERRMAHLLSLAVINRYGAEGWSCIDSPLAEGETAVGGVFIKRRCEKTTPARAMTVTAQFLRKPGQNAIDPTTQDYTQGQYESWTRFELMDPAFLAPATIKTGP